MPSHSPKFHIKKRHIAFVLLFPIVAFAGIVLFGMLVDGSGESFTKECLLRQPTKCGYADLSDEALLDQMRYAHFFSKGQARKLFLEAQKENDYYIKLYSEKQNLTSEEKRMKMIGEQEVEYFNRALLLVEKL